MKKLIVIGVLAVLVFAALQSVKTNQLPRSATMQAC